jgi:hypothetical protein
MMMPTEERFKSVVVNLTLEILEEWLRTNDKREFTCADSEKCAVAEYLHAAASWPHITVDGDFAILYADHPNKAGARPGKYFELPDDIQEFIGDFDGGLHCRTGLDAANICRGLIELRSMSC